MNMTRTVAMLSILQYHLSLYKS